MSLNDLHGHLDTLAGTPQSITTWRRLVETLKSDVLLNTLTISSEQEIREIATKLYGIVQTHDLGLQDAFFDADQIKSIIENETITALSNKIDLYLKRDALPPEDTTSGAPKASRKERRTNRRNKKKESIDEVVPEDSEPTPSRKERLEEAIAPVVEKRRKTFGKQQEAEPPLFTIDLDEDDAATPDTTTKKPSRRTTFREKKAAQCAALKDAINTGLNGLKIKKGLNSFRNGPDFDDFTMEEQGQIGLLGDYAKDFLENPAFAGQDLTVEMLYAYAAAEWNISEKKAHNYLLTLRKNNILTRSLYRGVIEMAGVVRPEKVIEESNNGAKTSFNGLIEKSKKALNNLRNGKDLHDYTPEEQKQIGLLGDYAQAFLEDEANIGKNLTDLMLCEYAKKQRNISYKKTYMYLSTLQKDKILKISRWRGIIEIEGVIRPKKIIPDMESSLKKIENHLIILLNKRQTPSFKELRIWFIEERLGSNAKRPNNYLDDDKLFFSALLDKLIQEGFIIARGRGNKTTYHKGPKFRTHTELPAPTPHALDNEALGVIYPHLNPKTLQLETRVCNEVVQSLKKILENHTKTPTLNGTQLISITDAIVLYETDADQLNQINPYTLLKLFDELAAPFPPSLWEWRNTLEKAYIEHIRQEEVVAEQARIKAHLLSQFTGDTLIDKLATKYIGVAYEEDDIPASLKSMFIIQVLPYFRECAGDLGTTHQYDARDITAFIEQCMEQDIEKELARAGIYMTDTPTTIEQGIVTRGYRGIGMIGMEPAESFAQALTLKKNASEQEEFIDELAYPDMHLGHLQKKPATTKIDHGTGLKGLKRKFSTVVSSAFADDTPTAKEKEYKYTLSEKYLEHCTPHLYTRTITRDEYVQIDQKTGTITYTVSGTTTTLEIDRKKPEEAMNTIAMDRSNGRNNEEKAKIIKALLKSYAENLVDTDGPQKFINKAGEPCILTVETRGKIVIYIDGTRKEEPFVKGDKASYDELLAFRSYISSAMEQFIPLDQRLHAERKIATGSVSLPSRSAERNAFNRSLGLSTRELAITKGKVITQKASTRKVRDQSVPNGYREEPVAAKDRDAEIILIPAAEELIDKSNAGQHIFTLPGNLTTFWKERTFIRFAEKIIEVKYIDTVANQKRYEVIAEWDSREKVYDDVDMNALLNKEIERMGNDEAIAHMQPLVSFIIPEQHRTDASQVYYFNPETKERFKGEDKDGHPGVSDRDLGDFATDIRSGNVLERGPELKVRVQAFATDKKGRMNGNRFERQRTGKDIHTLRMRKLNDKQIPTVLKESLHAKKAINDALAACLARLS